MQVIWGRAVRAAANEVVGPASARPLAGAKAMGHERQGAIGRHIVAVRRPQTQNREVRVRVVGSPSGRIVSLLLGVFLNQRSGIEQDRP